MELLLAKVKNASGRIGIFFLQRDRQKVTHMSPPCMSTGGLKNATCKQAPPVTAIVPCL